MKKLFISSLLSLGVLVGVLAPAIPAFGTVSCPNGSARSSADSYAECSTPETTGEDSLMSRVRIIITVVLGVLGVVAIAMIILGGVQYTTSQGNPEKVTQAKNIILYSIIGLVVALLGVAIVNFVLVNVFQ